MIIQIKNYNQYFDNALIYLKTAINHFQSITVSLPEEDSLKVLNMVIMNLLRK